MTTSPPENKPPDHRDKPRRGSPENQTSQERQERQEAGDNKTLQFRGAYLMSRLPGLSFHLLTLAAILLCTGLGFWQLERAEEKEQLLEQIRMGRAQPLPQEVLTAQLWSANSGSLLPLAVLAPYSQYQLYGIYDPERSVLLDNRTYEGRVGYHLLTPFRLINNSTKEVPHWILVNRGWIEAPRLRSDLPEFDTPLLPVSIQVQAKALQDDLQPEKLNLTWPVRVQQLSAPQLSELTGHALPEYEFRLSDAGQPGVMIPRPTSPNMQPEQHVGYSVQWFALAFTFTLMWSRPLWRRKKTKRTNTSDDLK